MIGFYMVGSKSVGFYEGVFNMVGFLYGWVFIQLLFTWLAFISYLQGWFLRRCVLVWLVLIWLGLIWVLITVVLLTLFFPTFYTVVFYVVRFYMVLIHLIFGMVSFLYGWLVILWFFNMVGVLCLGFLIWLVFILLDVHTVCFYRVRFLYDWSFYNGVFTWLGYI